MENVSPIALALIALWALVCGFFLIRTAYRAWRRRRRRRHAWRNYFPD